MQCLPFPLPPMLAILLLPGLIRLQLYHFCQYLFKVRLQFLHFLNVLLYKGTKKGIVIFLGGSTKITLQSLRFISVFSGGCQRNFDYSIYVTSTHEIFLIASIIANMTGRNSRSTSSNRVDNRDLISSSVFLAGN